MRTFTSIIFFFFVAGLKLFGQSNYSDLKNMFLSADSVFAISYESKSDTVQGLEYLLTEKYLPSYSLKEKRMLNRTQITHLLNILTKGKRILGRMTGTRNFKPRNALLIYKNSSLSYIDICFSCKRIETTKDIGFDNFDLRSEKWKAFELYFKNLNLINE